ncbi:hypothetical protein RJZ56_003773 [Blastomyces dermatitidis]|uniref:Uncharacterized protein n=2 Tax=Blastomyces TaxID=229219 RepID=A0A179V0A2_BLAGS|nr:uncharacterized protein BDBG_08115 [Blastomyces gilchristii SLH14081]EGE81900.1 hypothetical protein BDDG_04843 [Blastomyces dermatitidis ATCC 18188]EQL35900.1 hypothetical protein BDFG_02502 [Blastomyces dermatitidis ATCC 26199]OAT12817.1 hypothetical protein BDBG_08115 [Blastomyces gilchristii SLH14081]
MRLVLCSQSLTKKIGDLRTAKPPIRVEMMKGAPGVIRVLLYQFKFTDISDGVGVLPRNLMARVDAVDGHEYPDLFYDGSMLLPHNATWNCLKNCSAFKMLRRSVMNLGAGAFMG